MIRRLKETVKHCRRAGSRALQVGAARTAGEEMGRYDRGQMSGNRLIAVMLAITLAAAIGFVGVKVISEIQDSITDKDLSSTDAGNQTVYENTTESIAQGFADAMGLTDIVFLVLIFSVILGALLVFRTRA